jgi:hypothetical protein
MVGKNFTVRTNSLGGVIKLWNKHVTIEDAALKQLDEVSSMPFVKPYVAAYDAFPDAGAGWIDVMEATLREPARFSVRHSAAAEAQGAWLRETWQIDFSTRLNELLSRDPAPHRTRRIRRRDGNELEIGCGAWRAVFTVTDERVEILALEAAYPIQFLQRPDYLDVPDREAQLAFLAKWPKAPGGP